MIRRACYMMSYVAFESFNAFSFLSHDSRTSRIFPNFRASFLERSVQYATFMVIIAIGNYVEYYVLERTLEISYISSKFRNTESNLFPIIRLILFVIYGKKDLWKKKRILQKIMETDEKERCIKSYKKFL